MSRIIIKESDIRKYVRSLIVEAYEVEAVEDPEDVAERNKMLSGQSYNRRKFPNGGKSFKLEREYRNKMGYPPLRKPSGGVVPYLIDADGNDITPENKADATEYKKGKRKEKKNDYNRGRYTKKADKEYMSKGQHLTGDEQLALSPEEREDYREKVRRDNIAKNMDDNDKRRKSMNSNSIPSVKKNYDNEDEYGKFRWSDGIDAKGNPTRYKEYDFNANDSIENLRKRIRYNVAKRDKLDDNDANKKARMEYDKVIKSLKQVINLKKMDAEREKRMNYDDEPIVSVKKKQPSKMQDAIDAGYFDDEDDDY